MTLLRPSGDAGVLEPEIIGDEDQRPTNGCSKELDPALKEFIDRAIVPILVRECLKEQQARQVNWNTTEFWIDGACRGNQAHGRREAYGSISDGRTVERLQFADARTNNEAEYKVLIALLDRLVRNRVHPQKPQTNIFTDSQLLVGHLTKGAKVKATNLMPLHDEATLGLRKTGARLIWVPRDQIVEKLGH